MTSIDEKVDTSPAVESLRSIYEHLTRQEIAHVFRIEGLPDDTREAVRVVTDRLNALIDARNVPGSPLEAPPGDDGGVQVAIAGLQERESEGSRMGNAPLEKPFEPLLLPPSMVEEFWGELTDEASGSYTWREVSVDSASGALTWAVMNGGRTGTKSTATEAREVNLLAGVPNGKIVRISAEHRQNGVVVYTFPFNREFVIIAAVGANYTTVDQQVGAWNQTGQFFATDVGAAGAATEQYVCLVHSDYVLGTDHGLPIIGLMFDLEGTDIRQFMTAVGDVPADWHPQFEVRACRTDFDPSTVTWDWLGANMTYSAAHTFDMGYGPLTLDYVKRSDGGDISVQDVTILSRGDVAGVFNAETEVYGFEIRVTSGIGLYAPPPHPNTDWHMKYRPGVLSGSSRTIVWIQ